MCNKRFCIYKNAKIRNIDLLVTLVNGWPFLKRDHTREIRVEKVACQQRGSLQV